MICHGPGQHPPPPSPPCNNSLKLSMCWDQSLARTDLLIVVLYMPSSGPASQGALETCIEDPLIFFCGWKECLGGEVTGLGCVIGGFSSGGLLFCSHGTYGYGNCGNRQQPTSTLGSQTVRCSSENSMSI